MATVTGPAPKSIEELRGLLKEQFNVGELLKSLLTGAISAPKAVQINSLWALFEERNAAIVQHVLLTPEEEYVSSGYFDNLKARYESRMQELAKLGAKISPKPPKRLDPQAGTSEQKTLPTSAEQHEERLKDLLIRINIAKGEMRNFMDRIDSSITEGTPSAAVVKAKLVGLNRHWENIAVLHQKILRCPFKTGYNAEDTYLLEERFDICHSTLEELLDDDEHKAQPTNAQSLVREITMQIKILNKLLTHLKSISFQPQSQSFYEVKLEEITSLWSIIKDINQQIWRYAESSEDCYGYSLDNFTDQGIAVEESVSWLKENLRKFKSTTNSLNTEVEANIKLPTIQIPNFDGNWRVWKDFKGLFEEIIEPRSIGCSAKLRYLRSYLTGEPKNLVKHLPSTAEGYSTAWTILDERYDNNRAIVNNLFSDMENAAPVKSNKVNDLKRIHDTFKQNYLAYSNIKDQPSATEQSSTDDFIHYLLWSKLDEETQLQYEQQLEDRKSLQNLSLLFTFLESRFVVLSSMQSSKKTKTVLTTESKESSSNSSVSTSCVMCKSTKHSISSCPKFSQMTLEDRKGAVKLYKICFRCLKPGHRFLKCKASCTKCKGRHHALLHNDSFQKNDDQTPKPEEEKPTMHTAVAANVRTNTLLPTAKVLVYNHEGDLIPCRALLDSCSTSNFITTTMMSKLGLQPTTSECAISGIGGSETLSNECVSLRIKSNINKFSTQLTAIVIDEITGQQPQESCDLSKLKLPDHLVLADNDFHESRNVDLLLSTTITFSVLKSGQIRIGQNLFLQSTKLGWIVAGEAHQNLQPSRIYCNVGVAPSFKAVNDQLERFWEIEHHDSPAKTRTVEENDCEEHFINNFTRKEDGRYIVKIPFKEQPSKLGQSRDMALRRFYQLERRLSKDENLKVQYVKFMKEYLDLGHMTEVTTIPQRHYFIPHHAVMKLDSSTTKLRVVFDASAKTSNGISTNDLQMVGPTFQRELFDILLGFRLHKYVFTTDIQKMYRQIEVHPSDRALQLILWRDSSKEAVKTYQLNTVTYGTASAPYLATRCLHQLAMNEGDMYPGAAKAIMEETYVDDILTGGNTIEEVQLKKENLLRLLKEGCFELGKFASNSSEILEDIAEDKREKFLTINNSDVIKTLGLVWNPDSDDFNFFYNSVNCDMSRVTKREVLSSIARLFDPLGLVGPVVLLGKLFMKQLWKDNLQWDDTIKNPSEWATFLSQLINIKDVRVPRRTLVDNPSSIQLHAYSDASQYAYGCCLYLRSSNLAGEIKSMLLCSKSRLAPTSVESIARLELCAALLMAELVHRITKNFKYLGKRTFFYTDSQIVLTWINKPSYTLDTFVANRVAKIQRLSSVSQWRWIEGSNNPADIISKGMTAKNLQSSKLWFSGPEFLSQPETNWPNAEYTLLENVPNQKRIVLASTKVPTPRMLPNVGSYQKESWVMLSISSTVSR